MLQAYPKYERNDAVLYQLARAYELNAQPDKALAALDQLVAAYPRSRYRDEAQFRRGELLFAAKSYAKAQAAYEAVVDVGRTSVYYNQSLYKHGWSLFKQGENERSLDSFAGVLDSVLVSPRDPSALIELESLSRPNRELVEDTFRVMSITFSYLEGPKSIDDFVRRRKPRPYSYLLYARLGDLYIDKERYTDAADAYRAFVSQDRNNEKAPLLQMQAIEAYSKGGFPQLVLQGKKEFVEDYSYGTPYWQNRTPNGEPAVVSELKTNLKDVAQYYHAQAQRTKNMADYQEAAKWYRSFITSFPDDPQTAATDFLLADTLFESKQYLQAAQEYEHTAYGYGSHEKAASAGYAAIVAYGKDEEGLSGEAKAEMHTRGIDSSLRFAQAFPQHPETAQVLTRAAADLYAAKDYPRAITAAQSLLARTPPPDQPKQRIAWTVIANSEFEQGRYRQSRSRVQQRAGAHAAQRPRTSGHRRAARRGDLQARRTEEQGRRRRRCGRGLPARIARGTDIEGPVQCRLRCGRAVDYRETMGSGDRRAGGLPAQLSAEPAPGGRHPQAGRGLHRVESSRAGRRGVRADRAGGRRIARRSARGYAAGGGAIRPGRQYGKVAFACWKHS